MKTAVLTRQQHEAKFLRECKRNGQRWVLIGPDRDSLMGIDSAIATLENRDMVGQPAWKILRHRDPAHHGKRLEAVTA
jgi:hypothetical protein